MRCLIKAGLCFFFPAIFFACQLEDPKEIGAGLNPGTGNFGVVYTDTLTLRTSTVLVDSVVTSQSVRPIVGYYNDPASGTVACRSFFQCIYSSEKFDLGANPLYDSTTLFLISDSLSADLKKPIAQNLKVYRLTGDFDGARNYLNTDDFAFDPAPVGQYTYNRPANSTRKADTLRIRLNEATGQGLLSAYRNTLTETDFTAAFKGLAVGSDEANNTLSRFALGAVVMYYHNAGETAAKAVNFSASFGRFFNQIKSVRTGALGGLRKAYDAVPSTTTGNLTYIQSGTGLKTRIEMPSLKDLGKNRDIIINEARLVLKPVSGGVFSSVQLPPSRLRLYEADLNGRMPTLVQAGTPTAYFYVPLQGQLGSPDAALNTDGTYVFSVGGYLQQVLYNDRLPAAQRKDDKGLFVAVQSGAPYPEQQKAPVTPFGENEVTVRGMTLGSQQHPTGGAKLVIYYTVINPN